MHSRPVKRVAKTRGKRFREKWGGELQIEKSWEKVRRDNATSSDPLLPVVAYCNY